MTIYRGAGPGDAVVTILRCAAQDERLSYRARGLLVAVMSRPKDWRTDYRQLASEAREGERAVLNAMKELEQQGYLRRARIRTDDGKHIRTVWEISDDASRRGPTFLQPTKVQPTKVQPTRVQPTKVQRTKLQPTDVQPTNLQPDGVQPTDVQPTDVQPTELQPLLEGETKGDTPPPPNPLPVEAAARRATDELVVVVGDSLAGRAPTPATHGLRPACRRLVDLGWTPEDLDAAIDAHDWTGAKGAGVVLKLLKNLEAPPPRAARGAAKRPPWCGTCDEVTRIATDPETGAQPRRCPVCHPLSVQL